MQSQAAESIIWTSLSNSSCSPKVWNQAGSFVTTFHESILAPKPVDHLGLPVRDHTRCKYHDGDDSDSDINLS